MKKAVILSTACTPITKAFRGAFNSLKSPNMASYYKGKVWKGVPWTI